MILKNPIPKIATILPYKESYTVNKASAVSLWVSEFYKKSKFKKNNFIYGNTKKGKFLTNNYKNIHLDSIKFRFKSTSNEYTDKLIKELNKVNFDIIEIHNRPLILEKLIEKIKSKFIIYFHNDPLSMNGSKTISERKKILKNVSKIVFISKWVKKRFFLDMENVSDDNAEIIYHSINKRKKIKKENLITFVGKLNHSKGYDLYKDALIKILDSFPNWRGLSIGDESRRVLYIKHKNHKELGFLSHKKTLQILDKSAISVVPSRWEEPFGRVALEASACGCCTIVSKRGGLPEVSNHNMIIENITSNEIYNKITELIINKKKREEIQKLSRKNVKHIIDKNTKVIDNMRETILYNFNFNLLKGRLKIINLYNQGQKSNYRLFNISLGKKFTNGFIRNNHDVIEISDRDFLKNFNNPLLFKSNKLKFQKYLIEVFKNYKPDLFFFGHTNNISPSTLIELKSINKNMVISQWNEDPFMSDLKFSKKNIDNIKPYIPLVDHNFLTTHPSVLSKELKDSKKFHYFFIPVDRNIESLNVYNLKPQNDIFYAMSHGVNRGTLKEGFEDNRIKFLGKLIKLIPDIKYDFRGYNNRQPIWGSDFNNALINSKMALNLSRGKPTKYYTSNRIASILGNGLLTFIDKKTHLSDFFSEDEVIFYENIFDLASKIKFYSKNDKLRRAIAKKGKTKYFKLFDGNKITKYIIDISFGKENRLFK